jgi:hypothetical protein
VTRDNITGFHGEKPVAEKLEFVCDCGRRYIIIAAPSAKPRKCPKCGRVMRSVAEKAVEPEQTAHNKPQNPFDGMEETWEYEYKFDQRRPDRHDREPFTLGSLVKKFWRLFFPGRRSRRYY